MTYERGPSSDARDEGLLDSLGTVVPLIWLGSNPAFFVVAAASAAFGTVLLLYFNLWRKRRH